MQKDRTISLNAAIDAVHRDYDVILDFKSNGSTIADSVEDILSALPSVQSEWIPCSERCPERRIYVLVTYKSVYGIPDIGITWYSKSERKWNTSREVLAWMPLPKPYEGERDDNT